MNPAAKHVSLLLLPVHTSAVVAAAVPALLAPRLTGKATHIFRSLSGDEARVLEALLTMAYSEYIAG